MTTPVSEPAIPSSVTSRQDWVDAAKGVAIILVVLGHTWRGLEARGLITADLFTAVDSRIYAFHMPVFFALSGMFFTRSLARMSSQKFLFSRLTRLIWPMVLWTYLFLMIKLLAGNAANNPIDPQALLIWPVPGYLHLWFLWALFLLHLALLASRPLLQDGAYPATALATIFALSYVAALIPWGDTLNYWAGPALRFAPFLILGILVNHAIRAGWDPTRLGPAGRLSAAILFSCLLLLWPMLPDSKILLLGVTLVLVLCFLLVLAGFDDMAQKVPLAWLITLGTASMAIYLTHTICAAALREALLGTGLHALWLQLIGGTAIGLLGPLVVLALARRLNLVRVLGF